MKAGSSSSPLWWVEPGVTGGMPMPWLHPDRREALGGALTEWDDELEQLHAEGVRAVVCLLNIPGDRFVYPKAGFDFHLMPLPNGGAPTQEQTFAFPEFMRIQNSSLRPVAIHCEAGLGRTGTVIAAWLISQGFSPEDALNRVRSVQPMAIETAVQVNYLHRLPQLLQSSVPLSA